MEENTNLMAINFDLSGMMTIIAEGIDRIRTAFEEIKEIIASSVGPMLRAVPCIAFKRDREIIDHFIYCIASPREWHLMKYSKRRRIRKKYRDQLLRRLAFALDYVGQ